MGDLTGKTINSTYKDLLKIRSAEDNTGIDSVSRLVEDGDGTPSALKLSTTTAEVTGTFKAAIVDLNSGAIDNTTIGTSTPNVATFTTLTSTTSNATTSNLGTLGSAVNHAGHSSTNVDIDSGTIDNTSVGSMTRSTGEFSRLSVGVAKSSVAEAKINRADATTQFDFSDLEFYKTGVLCANMNAKVFYDFLAIHVHDATTAGSFSLELECILTSGTAPGDHESGDEIDVSTFVPDGKTFSYFKQRFIGMHRLASTAPSGSDQIRLTKVIKPQVTIAWDYLDSGSNVLRSGTNGPLVPEQHLHKYAYSEASEPGNPEYAFGESSVDKGIVFSDNADGSENTNYQTGWSQNSTTWAPTVTANVIYGADYGIKLPKSNDMFNWINWNTQHTTSPYLYNRHPLAAEGRIQDIVNTTNLPIWGTSNGPENSSTYDASTANDNGGIPESWSADTERTIEICAYMHDNQVEDNADNAEMGNRWILRIGTTSGYYGAQDSTDKVQCITYKVRVLSTYDGENSRGYVEKLKRTTWG